MANRYGFHTMTFREAIKMSLNGDVVLWATPKGNVVLIEEKKFDREYKNVKETN